MHIVYLSQGNVKNCDLYAVCDTNPARLAAIEEKYGDRFVLYDSVAAVLADPQVEAVFICTPHYDHPTIAIEAFKQDKHVLIEKPAGVYTEKVRAMNAAALAKPNLSFGIMYNQRTNPLYQKVVLLQSFKSTIR